MVLNEMLERFAKNSPIPVALRATMERVLSPDTLDEWFELNADKQYTRELLFSTLFDLMGAVVFQVFPSVNSAYQSRAESIPVSITAVYNKLNGVDVNTSSALVRDTGRELADLTEGLKAQRTALLPGYRVKMLDGHCIEKSEHRLEVLRHTKAGPLPGKSLVVYDHELDLAVDVFPCEDGHAQERSLLHQVLPTVNLDDVWVADRNFCVQDFLSGIDQASGYYIIRRHQHLPIKETGEPMAVGDSETGTIKEQCVKVTDSKKNNEHDARLISIQLTTPTRDGDDTLQIISNLPKDIDAQTIAAIYRKRWSIETMFQHLTTHLHSEINTLGYPKAALFGFCISLVVYNVLSVVKAAMRSVHGEEKIEEEVSGYYIAGEVSRTVEGMAIALPDDEWVIFSEWSKREFIQFLTRAMKNVTLSKYKKHTRGPKKSRPKRDQHPNDNHVSTFRLLRDKVD
ncbi:IS4 family transposase [bacterium]|nr:IS4 family transposase [bacterium]